METLSIEGYTFLRELGSGGYGRVLLAERRTGSTLVAIKCFDPVNEYAVKAASSDSDTTLEDLQSAFLEYAQGMRELPRREGLVAVLNSERDEDGLPYYISPYIPGCLADLLGNDVFEPAAIQQLPEAQRPRRLKPQRVMQIFEQALVALEQMHSEGRVHRDIKPANLRLTAAGDLCLVDFSILKTAEGLAARGGFAPDRGCFDYTCPQLRQDALAGEPSADLYSLACVCYRALTAKLPRDKFAEPASEVPELGAASNDLLLWMLESDANARPLDAATALDAYRSRHRSTSSAGSAGNQVAASTDPSSGGFASRVIAAQAMQGGDHPDSDAAPSNSETPTELVATVPEGNPRPPTPARSRGDVSGADKASANADADAARVADTANDATQLMGADAVEARAELHRQIANRIHHKGRIDDAGRDTLIVFCDIADIPIDSLEKEIAEVLTSDSTLAAKARLAQRVCDSAVDDDGRVDQAALQELLGAARYVGWEMEDLQRIAGPGPGAGPGESKTDAPAVAPSWRKPEQNHPPPASSSGGKGPLIGAIIGIVAVIAIGGFFAWQWWSKEDAVQPIVQPVPVPAAAAAAEIAADRARMETEWALALELGTLKGFQDFVASWPDSPFAQRARTQMEQIREAQQRQAALDLLREKTANAVHTALVELGYLDPQLANDPDAIAAAIDQFEVSTSLPSRGQADDATLIALRAERVRREDETWIGALEADSEDAYLDYLDRYPEGPYTEQAEQKLADLQQRQSEQMQTEQIAAEEAAARRAAEQAAQRRQAEAERALQQQRLAEQRSESISQIQDQLQRLGFPLARSGELDPATREALAEIQQPADGSMDLEQLEAVLETLTALPDPAVNAEPFVPVVVRRVEPRYPSRAVRERTEGWVEAEVSVDEQGQVSAVSIVDTSHRRLFDREVEEALRQWRFEPRIVDDEAVPFATRQRFDFSLGDG